MIIRRLNSIVSVQGSLFIRLLVELVGNGLRLRFLIPREQLVLIDGGFRNVLFLAAGAETSASDAEAHNEPQASEEGSAECAVVLRHLGRAASRRLILPIESLIVGLLVGW